MVELSDCEKVSCILDISLISLTQVLVYRFVTFAKVDYSLDLAFRSDSQNADSTTRMPVRSVLGERLYLT